MRDDLRVALWVAGFVGCVLLVIAVLGAVVGTGVYFVDRNQCHSFGRQSNREVKFVRYTLVSWDCLTPTADGKWISTDNLREFGEQP